MEAESSRLGGANCACPQLADTAIIGMGDPDGLDERVFASLEIFKNHGGRQWWLHASRCGECGQAWMIAQEERVHDNYLLKRLPPDVVRRIVERDSWPADFLRFEDVIRLEVDSGKVAVFLDPRDLRRTVGELVDDRADITADEISYLLCVPQNVASDLMSLRRRKAGKIWWLVSRLFGSDG